jgi:hypothetical protein
MGQTGTLCVSILLRPQQQQGGLQPGETRSLEQHLQWQQQQQQQLAATSMTGASAAGSVTARSAFSKEAQSIGNNAAARHIAAINSTNVTPAAVYAPDPHTHMQSAATNLQQRSDETAGLRTAPSSQLQQQPSLLEEVPEFASHPSAELDRMTALSQPGLWCLRSFVVAAASSSSQTSQQQQQQGQSPGSPDAAAAAAAIAAAATVPGAEEQAASEAAADEEQDEAVLQDEDHQEADDLLRSSSWWDQHKQQLLQRLHLPLPNHLHHHQRHSAPHNHLQQASSTYNKKHHVASHKHAPHHQQQRHGSANQEAARHLFMRLGRGVDRIRPLLAEARMLREAVVVEQASWLRLLTTGPAWQPWGVAGAARAGPGRGVGFGAAGPLPIGAWVRLVEALHALLERRVPNMYCIVMFCTIEWRWGSVLCWSGEWRCVAACFALRTLWDATLLQHRQCCWLGLHTNQLVVC